MSQRDEQPTSTAGLPAPPWLAGSSDDPGYFEEATPDAQLQLRVAPQVHILVDASYQLAVSVKGGAAVINPAVLLDAVDFAARWIASHQPPASREKQKP